jgi:hypothetical protein
MSKIVSAEYDEKEQVLRLTQPLRGIVDGEQVDVAITESGHADEKDPSPASVDSHIERPWLTVEGTLSAEAGDSLAAAVDEMFGSAE